jgi:ABC-type transporter Mla subunit MlaD
MDIEWFRDLSITIMGFVTTAVLIFAAIIIYRLYRKMTATLSLAQTLVNSVNDTVITVEEAIKSTSQNINDTITDVQDSVRQVSKGISDTFTNIQDRIKPLVPILAVIQGISEGIKSITKIFKKESDEGENTNE